MAQLRALEGREPDTQDIPEVPEESWRQARRGAAADAMWKARKEPISLRVTPFRVSVFFPTWRHEHGIGWERAGLACGFGAVRAVCAGERDGAHGAGARVAGGLGG